MYTELNLFEWLRQRSPCIVVLECHQQGLRRLLLMARRLAETELVSLWRELMGNGGVGVVNGVVRGGTRTLNRAELNTFQSWALVSPVK